MNAQYAQSPLPPRDSGATLGLVGSSLMDDEHRVPIHPDHFDRIPADLRARIIVESGYGLRFGVSDSELAGYFSRVGSRAETIAVPDIVLIPKPQLADLEAMRSGQVLWGWPHCVQDVALTQLAIEKKLTLIAFEQMNHWHEDGSFNLHVFHANNELAGYCSVFHALQLQGMTGNYGRRLSATVIGFGATARGAVTALSAHGISDVRVLTSREVAAVASPIHSVEMVHVDYSEGPLIREVTRETGTVALASFLSEGDIVVNCVLQDPNAPVTYLCDEDLHEFRQGSLIVDVSCDEGMGFAWARPTSFAEPTFEVGHGVTYYAVDHSPSYLWNSASWENSAALLPFLDAVLAGPESWDRDATISRAIEIRDGVIVNSAILDFQSRDPRYPHATRATTPS